MARRISFKRIQIDKANSSIVAAVAISAFALVFCLITSRSLWVQQGYQGRVIDKKTVAKEQLQSNLASLESLESSYKAFVTRPENVIGGNSANSRDESGGDNAKIILDALPSVYDFPALLSSVESMMRRQNVPILGIAGSDLGDPNAPPATGQEIVPDPMLDEMPVAAVGTAVDMPFTIEARTSYQGVRDLLGLFERSIRPMKVNGLTLNGNDSELNLSVDVTTHYQPGVLYQVDKEIVQ